MSDQAANTIWSERRAAAAHRAAGSSAARRALSLAVLLRLVDLLAVLIAVLAAEALVGLAPDEVPLVGAFAPLLQAAAFWLVAECRGLYEPVQQRELPARAICSTWIQACGLLVVGPLLLAAPLMPADETQALLRGCWPLLPLFMLLAPGFLLAGRAIVLAVQARAGSLQVEEVGVLIYGTGTAAVELGGALARNPGCHLVLRGFVDPTGTSQPGVSLGGVPVIGLGSPLAAAVRSWRVQSVLVPLALSDSAGIEAAARDLAAYPVALKLVPDLALRGIPMQLVDHSAALPMVQICAPPPRLQARLAKRAEDLILTPILLVLALPVLVVAAIAIKLDSRGPILFRQERSGAEGRPFFVYKFRTMHVDETDAHGEVQVTRTDPRVTRVGAFLRRTSIDELPQFFNVLRGDMSLVGPRPHARGSRAGGLPFEQAVAIYAARQRIRPGMTGWAQVNGWRGETDTREKLTGRIEHDLWYISNWSVGLDLVVLLRSVAAMVRGHNAY